jgi:hypothetical protein
MSQDHDQTPERTVWPYTEWKLYVGRVIELGDGVRMGLLRVTRDGAANVQVFRPEDPAGAQRLTLRAGQGADCFGRQVRLLEVDRSGPRSWIRLDAQPTVTV